MINWIEVLVWIIGFLMLYIGITKKILTPNTRGTWIATFSGIIILLGGTLLWYASSHSLEKLSENHKITAPIRDPNKERNQIQELPPSERREISIKLAKAAYAAGENDLQVLSENGGWIPFTADDQDKKARTSHLQLLEEVAQQRSDLFESAEIAKQQAMKWALSLLIAIALGITTGLFLKKQRS